MLTGSNNVMTQLTLVPLLFGHEASIVLVSGEKGWTKSEKHRIKMAFHNSPVKDRLNQIYSSVI
jgi:hypothetical protein